jgi:molecular chaperone GrpE
MALLFGNPFKNEFVVDELPEDMPAPARGKRPVQMWRNQIETPGADTVDPHDLSSQVASLLREQERLEHLAHHLKTQRDDPGREELQKFLRSSLTVLDGFDRVTQMAQALPPSQEVHNWLKSVEAIQSRMVGLCERFGLRAMDPVGKPVDLDEHEVIEVLNTNSISDETVVEVRQKGYLLDGRILRDAQVVVAKNEGS